MELVFGRVPHPPFEKAIVPKPAADGAGFTLLARNRVPVGVCSHRTWGMGDVWGIYRLFATGGERQWDALTDYVVGLDGRILMLNDPRGKRMPWANGGSDGLEGDGVGYVRTFGVQAINERLVSIENIGLPETPFDGAQFEASAKLVAYWHDQARMPWDRFPFHPTHGTVTDLQHYEFAVKDCPFKAFRDRTEAFQNRVRAILKQYQTTATQDTGSEPAPGPVDNPANAAWPNGWTTAQLAARFGQLQRIDQAGTVTTHAFNAKGPISNAWVARGVKQGITEVSKLPRPARWMQVTTDTGTTDVIIFDGAGEKDWIAFNPVAASSATLRWAE